MKKYRLILYREEASGNTAVRVINELFGSEAEAIEYAKQMRDEHDFEYYEIQAVHLIE